MFQHGITNRHHYLSRRTFFATGYQLGETLAAEQLATWIPSFDDAGGRQHQMLPGSNVDRYSVLFEGSINTQR